MRKRRASVPVSPGKDVTLYIPAETHPRVVEYMNRLKAEGRFSQGVVDILTSHILRETAPRLAVAEDEDDPYPEAESPPAPDAEFTAVPLEGPEEGAEEREDFSLEALFRQANRNAAKLQNRSDTEAE